jgi:hypothetical protein
LFTRLISLQVNGHRREKLLCSRKKQKIKGESDFFLLFQPSHGAQVDGHRQKL